jgi:hypothetical protein
LRVPRAGIEFDHVFIAFFAVMFALVHLLLLNPYS